MSKKKKRKKNEVDGEKGKALHNIKYIRKAAPESYKVTTGRTHQRDNNKCI